MTEPLDPGPNPARVTITRMVEFGDIDKSGHYHNACVIRWMEAAEAILHTRLGIADSTFGFAPRVSVELKFLDRLYFMDEVQISLTTVHVGRSSVRYDLRVAKGESVAATGSVVTVHVPQQNGRSEPWPDEVRRQLREGGER